MMYCLLVQSLMTEVLLLIYVVLNLGLLAGLWPAFSLYFMGGCSSIGLGLGMQVLFCVGFSFKHVLYIEVTVSETFVS